MSETPDPTGPDEREALDYTDIANRAQAETGRSIWPSTVEAIVKHLPTPRPDTVSEEAESALARLIAPGVQRYDGKPSLFLALAEVVQLVIQDVYADCGDSSPDVLSSNIAHRLEHLLRQALPHLPGGQSEADIRAEAWDQGYRSGHSNAMRRMSDEPQAPTTPNPYRGDVQ